MTQNLNEGLRPLDLADMILPIFEVDTYSSKMGEDRDVCVVSFTVKDRSPAQDFMEFIEKGFSFVLDADVSSGEDENGDYKVFVEMNRGAKLTEHIGELLYGLRKLTGMEDFKFRYHQSTEVHNAINEKLDNVVPQTHQKYEETMHQIKTEGIRRFFNKTLMDDLTLDENNVITIHKAFSNQIKLKILDEGSTDTILENNKGTIMMDADATAEVFWLSKVLGDYNINKVGGNLLFNNGKEAMLLQQVGL